MTLERSEKPIRFSREHDRTGSPECGNLYAERHNGVDDVVVILLECLHSLVP